MKNRLFRRVIGVATMLLVGVALMMPLTAGSQSSQNALSASIPLSAEVTPSSDGASFQMTVKYVWYKNQGSKLLELYCYYTRPDGTTVNIGSIYPSSDVIGGALSEDGWVTDFATLVFSVAMPDGTVPEGEYTAICSGSLGEIETSFTVKSQATAAPAETKPATTAAPTVYNLQVEMVIPGKGYEMTAKWGGPVTVESDGSVRTKIPGTITATVPLEMNGNRKQSYAINVTFNVDVAGTGSKTSAGITLLLAQNFADYQVQVTVAKGNIDSISLAQCREATEKNAPKWLDQILTGMEFENVQLPATQDVTVGRWKGTATLSLSK